MSEDHIEKLRYQQMRQNSDVRRIELEINEEWRKFQVAQSKRYINLMYAQGALTYTINRLGELGVRADDIFPSELIGLRSSDNA